MTEQEWSASEDPAAMLYHAQNIYEETPTGFSVTTRTPLVSDRKLRLWVCACCHLTGALPDEPIAACEAWADGGPAVQSSWLCALPDPRKAATEVCNRRFGLAFGPDRDLQPAKAALLRDIVGNPSRPVAMPKKRRRVVPSPDIPGSISPGFGEDYCPWFPSTVLALAQVAYDERLDDCTLDPQRLAVLSDALEEAGCDNVALLDHLRGVTRDSDPTPWEHRERADNDVTTMVAEFDARLRGAQHVRGCWAIDLILGRN